MAFDPAWLSVITTSLGMARQIAGTAQDIRDFNQFATTISQINDQLLKAQDGLLNLNAGMFALQQEHLETTKELAKLKEALAERGRYALFQIARGKFVYRAEIGPPTAGASDPVAAEPEHYICQVCFDGHTKAKVVLQFSPQNAHFGRAARWFCPACKTSIVV